MDIHGSFAAIDCLNSRQQACVSRKPASVPSIFELNILDGAAENSDDKTTPVLKQREAGAFDSGAIDLLSDTVVPGEKSAPRLPEKSRKWILLSPSDVSENDF